jgi:hypothetical protein
MERRFCAEVFFIEMHIEALAVASEGVSGGSLTSN